MKPNYELVKQPEDRCFHRLHMVSKSFGHNFHYHEDCELTLIVRGYGTRLVGTSVEAFESGDLILLGPKLPHAWLDHGEQEVESRVLQFQLQPILSANQHLKSFNAVTQLLNQGHRGIHFSGLAITDIIDLYQDCSDENPAIASLNFYRLLNQLTFDIVKKKYLISETESPHWISGTNKRLEAMIHFMQTNFNEDWSLEDLAAHVHMNPSSASRYFSKQMGSPIFKYLNRIRIAHACEMLSHEDQSILRICLSCGFQSVIYFNRVFKELKNMTPKEYRKLHSKRSRL